MHVDAADGLTRWQLRLFLIVALTARNDGDAVAAFSQRERQVGQQQARR